MDAQHPPCNYCRPPAAADEAGDSQKRASFASISFLYKGIAMFHLSWNFLLQLSCRQGLLHQKFQTQCLCLLRAIARAQAKALLGPS
eukprot:1158483-Pelagomonas_calceolata.AAC.9